MKWLKKLNTNNSPLSALRFKIIVSASCLVLILSLAVGVTMAWYNANIDIKFSAGELSSAEAAYSVGYEVFKYQDDHGIKVSDDVTEMNLYDRVYPKNNEKASIILRAILSDDLANYVDSSGVVHLTLNCAFDKSGRDEGDTNGDEIIDYLSNVINVKAAYIPNITDNAMTGTYDTGKYVSADDYIYDAASEYFDNQSGSVKFVGISDVEGVDETDTTYKLTTYTRINDFNNRTEQKGGSRTEEGNITVTDTYEYYYLISSGNNYMYFNNDDRVARQNVTLSPTNVENYLQQLGFKVKLNETTTKYSFTSIDGSKYLNAASANNGTVSASTSEQLFTLSNGIQFSYTSGRNTYRIRYNNGFVTTTGNTGVNLTITQVEKRTTTRYRAAAHSLGNKKIEITAPLGEQFKSSDGFYYMYLQFDYDEELISTYFLQNHIIFKVGADEKNGTEFKDKFSISVVKETP